MGIMMLKSQDAASSTQASAAPPRVTPEELSRALAAIEARRQSEAARLAGTIPIDQAVTELHLDSTSEEIWAEVQAHRAAAVPTQAQTAKPQLIAQRPRRRRAWSGFLAPVVLVGALLYAGVIPHHFGGHSPRAAAPVLRSLSQIPDGKEVYADDSALVQVSEGKPPAQITVSENATGNRWAMVKIGPHVYLHGYIARTSTLQPLQGKPLNIYNDDNAGELEGNVTSNITLRVDQIPLQKSGGDGDFSEVTLPHFQPDPLTTLNPWH